MKRILLLALVLSLLLAACSPTAPAQTADQPAATAGPTNSQYTNISVAELQQMLENKDFLMVNVHIPFEGDLPQTDLSIPYDQIDQHLDQLPDKDAKIVLYCRSDRMSHIAAQRLVELGYTHIYNLVGGFNAWKDAGLPMQEP